MNYFELYQIPISLQPDINEIKAKFYALSRKFHPDFYTNETATDQQFALEQSALINKAFKIFNHQTETIKYVLQLKNLIEDEEKYTLSSDFLMDVMELNEQLVEAKIDDDINSIEKVKLQISQLEKDIYEPVKSIIENYQEGITTQEELLQVKEYYFRKKYLNRILAGLN
jgi:molecular chaperone HscB